MARDRAAWWDGTHDANDRCDRGRAPRRPPEPHRHPYGDGGHGRCLRRYRPGWLLECGVLGRGDVRRLHPLPERGSVGAPADLRKLMPNSRLQMLLRGQNLLGYRHYEDMVVDKFVEKSAENGMDVFRVFDALNDPRNMAQAMAAVKKAGKHAQGTICYTMSPLHTTEGYIKLAGQLLDMGAESIALKDMAALLQPQPSYDIVKGIKDTYGDVQINVHCHATTGVTLVSLMKAIEAGADVVDTSISSMSLGPGHNPTESLVAMLEGTEYTTNLDPERLIKIRDHFAAVRPKYKAFESATLVDTDIFSSQIPGGMLSNMESQLKQQGAGDRIKEVME